MPRADFALALLRLGGVGRVTAHRVLAHFASPEALRATPREQVRLRLKGAPRAEATVAKLFGADLDEALDAARAQTRALAPKGVAVLASGDAGWPAGLDALPAADRPVCLWRYGHAGALARGAAPEVRETIAPEAQETAAPEAPALAVLGRAGLPPAAFEAAQRLARAHAAGGVVTGAKDGFDLAVQKTAVGAGARVVAVAPCGLAKLAPSLRPGATAVVKAGGALVSPFPMGHGPFDHDEREAALVAAAVARALAASGGGAGAGSPEAKALAWARGAGRPVADLDATGAEAAIAAALAPGAAPEASGAPGPESAP